MIFRNLPAQFKVRWLILIAAVTFLWYFWVSNPSVLGRPSWHLSNKSPPNKGSVVMVTGSAGTNAFLGIPHLKEMAYENRRTYAYKHGYEFMWANITSYPKSPVPWNKIYIVQEGFRRYPKAEWVWWLDMDIIIMNMSLSLHDHILSPDGLARNILLDYMVEGIGGGQSGYKTPSTYKYEDINFILPTTGWGLNDGSFLMRRSEWTEMLLDFWVDPLYLSQDWIFFDQDAWTHMWQHHEIVRNHTAVTNQRALTPYPEDNPLGEHWQQGDLVVHFAGCGASPECPSRWDLYWNKREQCEVPAFIKQKLEDGTAEIEDVQYGADLPSD